MIYYMVLYHIILSTICYILSSQDAEEDSERGSEPRAEARPATQLRCR